jgi:hypothetical protein
MTHRNRRHSQTLPNYIYPERIQIDSLRHGNIEGNSCMNHLRNLAIDPQDKGKEHILKHHSQVCTKAARSSHKTQISQAFKSLSKIQYLISTWYYLEGLYGFKFGNLRICRLG